MMRWWVPLWARLTEAGVGMLAVALFAGVTAAWTMHRHITARVAQAEALSQVPTEIRMVAAVDLLPQDTLDASVIATRDIPVDWIHQDSLGPEAFMDWEGTTFKHAVRQGEQILSTYLGRTANAPLASRLAPGRRAVTISVDDVGSQAGMLQPGNRLDIFVTLDHAGHRETTLLLQSHLVLAVGNRADADGAEGVPFSTVTLDVSSPAAVRLIAARQMGSLTAVLADEQSENADGLVPLTNAVEIALGLKAAPKPPKQKNVPVIYGTGAGQGSAASSTAEVPIFDSRAAHLPEFASEDDAP